MDDATLSGYEAQLPPVLRFVPDRRFTVGAAGGAVVTALLAALTGDAPTRLLFGLAALVLLAYAAGDVVFSPRIEADPYGVVVRSPLTRARLGWDEIDSVRADVSTRRGLRSTTLEIDAGDVLAVLSRRAIGTDPERAAALIRAMRAPSPGEGASQYDE